MDRWKRIICLLALALCGAVSAGDIYVIPFDVDPPIEADGRLDDWQSVPNPIHLETPSHVTYGREAWSGPEDASGVIRLAWRPAGLFIAAEVVDDRVQQPYSANEMYKADHVNVWIDHMPGVDPKRGIIGTGQVHVGLSPGNLDDPASQPEIFIFRPLDLPTEGGKIVARRTDKGYLIEAFIPFNRLGIDRVTLNRDINFEVAISEGATMVRVGTAIFGRRG